MESLKITDLGLFAREYELKDLDWRSYKLVSSSMDHKRYYFRVDDAELSIIKRIINFVSSIFYLFNEETSKSLFGQAVSGKLELCFYGNKSLEGIFNGNCFITRSNEENQFLGFKTLLRIVASNWDLRKLYLSYNQLTSLPETIGNNLINLRELWLSDNQLTSLPETIGNLTNLQNLYLSRNRFTSLPETIGNLTNLRELYLSDNQLTSLPETIGNLTNLRDLYLLDNQLTSLPETIGNLTNLRDLNLSDNQLTSLSEIIGNLTNLRDLNLSDNQLTILPEIIGNLTNLEGLNLSDNQLTSLPETIGNLTSLQFLSLENNQLTNIPDCLYQLPLNCRVYLTGNPLTEASINEMQSQVNQPGYQGPQFIFSAIGLEQNRNQTFASLEKSLENWFGKDHHLNFSTWDEKDRNNLSLWLIRLEETKDYKENKKNQEIMKNRVKELLSWFLQEKDISSIENVKRILDEATSTCGDRVARSLNEIWFQKKIAESSTLNLSALKDLIIGLKRYELLQKIAEEKCSSLKSVDPIEVYLCYETRLKEELKLPLETKGMLYERFSNVTEADLIEAKDNIFSQTKPLEKQIEILSENPIWKNRLENESGFKEIKTQCENKKNSELKNIDPNDEQAASNYFNQFKINEKTIWNPFYLFTKQFLEKENSKMEED